MKDLALRYKHAGHTDEEIREELRGTVLDCGDFPTCSAVEEIIKFVNEEYPRKITEYKKKYIDFLVSCGIDKETATRDCEGWALDHDLDEICFDDPVFDAKISLENWEY